jgi:DNA primase
MSRYRGREIDDIGLWSNYIEVPQGAEKETSYWTKVKCPNPDHDTEKRHFQVNVEQGLVHCFAYCGISGTYAHAIKTIEGCDDRQARKILLGFAGRSKRKTRVVRQSVSAKNSIPVERLEYEQYILPAGIEYLDARGITAQSIVRYGLGWCPETLRVVIPGRDLRKQTRFLIKRGVRESQQPKYLYTEGFPKTSLLFGACECALGVVRSKGVIVVEGSIDTICVDQWGILPVVGQLGTGISERQVEILSQLRPKRVYLFFDKDAAGVQSIQIAERRLRRKYPVFIVRYPVGKSDPAECTRKEGLRQLERAMPLRNFKRRVERKVRTHG